MRSYRSYQNTFLVWGKIIQLNPQAQRVIKNLIEVPNLPLCQHKISKKKNLQYVSLKYKKKKKKPQIFRNIQPHSRASLVL